VRDVDWRGIWYPERSPWETVLRAVVVYVFVHVAFRVVGRRELGGHSAYVIVLLFLVGVAMRQSIVGDDGSLTTAMIGLSTLLALDALARWLSYHSPRAAIVIHGPVRELVRDGRVNERELRRAHVSRGQLLSAARVHGCQGLAEVRLASLEPSGHISFVLKDRGGGVRPSRWGRKRAQAPRGGARRDP
jgi:uncharacterized membrane protein YcaP (DUF421 family)